MSKEKNWKKHQELDFKVTEETSNAPIKHKVPVINFNKQILNPVGFKELFFINDLYNWNLYPTLQKYFNKLYRNNRTERPAKISPEKFVDNEPLNNWLNNIFSYLLNTNYHKRISLLNKAKSMVNYSHKINYNSFKWFLQKEYKLG